MDAGRSQVVRGPCDKWGGGDGEVPCEGGGGSVGEVGGGWRGAAAQEEWIGLRDGCVMVGGWGRRVHVRHDVAQSGAAY